MINATKYSAFITIFYLTQNIFTHLSLVLCFFHCLWDGNGNGKSEGHVHLIWMSFNGSISILKGITGVKLIQFNTVNNLLVWSWVIFSVKCLNCCCRAGDGGAARGMELCCLLMPALPAFCHNACLLQQYQGDLLISSSVQCAAALHSSSSGQRLLRLRGAGFEIVHLFSEQNRLFLGTTWSSPCLSVSFSHEAAFISRAVPGTSILGSSVFACWLNLTTCLCSD